MDDNTAWVILVGLRQERKFVHSNATRNSLKVPVQLTTTDDNQKLKVTTLVNSGCTGSLISSSFIKAEGINTQPLPYPISVYNANRTMNANGKITDYFILQMKIGKHLKKILFEVTDFDKVDLFIGDEWLKRHNSQINWQEGTMEFECGANCYLVPQLILQKIVE